MRLITPYELATLSDDELRLLYRQTMIALTRSAADSAERRNALATLENIARVLRTRDGPRP